ncbi:MAG TPA: PIN domain-containing protein [Verrucomicrobiae bacterium]|nr:PIN domain-containing protein [Verrucomicrobiae bacterium]
MPVLLMRATLILACGAACAILSPFVIGALPGWANVAVNALTGLAAGALAALVEWRLRRARFIVLVGGLVGVVAGSGLGFLLLRFAGTGPGMRIGGVSLDLLRPVVLLICAYAGGVVFGHKAATFQVSQVRQMLSDQPAAQTTSKLLDTSVIIDGRIADVAETGFLDGVLVVPQFVLRELQAVADSSDPLKRNRGRKGLDILQRIKKNPNVNVSVVENDFPEVKEVDQKLIELARRIGAKIITNDFNLNKVAQLSGIDVLNINELANSLKPVVLPGETMKVFIVKEGKEQDQGVAYLDDGTMVVVNAASKQVGKTVDVTVTSVVQTAAGKMFFGRCIADNDRTIVRRPQREKSAE